MIKQFDSTYAGHIDLKSVGNVSTPVNERRYPNENLRPHYKRSQVNR